MSKGSHLNQGRAVHLELDMAGGCFVSQGAADEDPISGWTMARDAVQLPVGVHILLANRQPLRLERWLETRSRMDEGVTELAAVERSPGPSPDRVRGEASMIGRLSGASSELTARRSSETPQNGGGVTSADDMTGATSAGPQAKQPSAGENILIGAP
jgi:hypothetical protein